MRNYLAIGCFGIVMGCAQVAHVTPSADISTLRNPAAPVASQADVSAADLAGAWVVRQTGGNRWPVLQQSVHFQTDGDDLILPARGVDCDPLGVCHGAGIAVRYAPIATGRWRVVEPLTTGQAVLPPEIWVHWMDFDDRTMAIGNPNGNMVAILDRSANGGADRIVAARDILDWFGYDLAQINERPQ